MPACTHSTGNILFDTLIAATLTPPASIPANAVTYAAYTITGLQLLDMLYVQPLSDLTTISVVTAYVSAANTLRIGWGNESGSTVTSAPAVQLLIKYNRPENAAAGFGGLPTQAL